MTARLRSAVLVTAVGLGSLAGSAPARSTPPACPSAVAISAALKTKATASGDCDYESGSFDELTIEITATADVKTEMARLRADALSASAPVTKTRVGAYPAFTGAAADQARLSYDQKGVFVFLSSTPATAQSQPTLAMIGAALAKLTLAKNLTDCAAVTSVVAGAAAGATFDSVQNNTLCLQARRRDPDGRHRPSRRSRSDNDEFRLFTQRPKLTDVKVKARRPR